MNLSQFLTKFNPHIVNQTSILCFKGSLESYPLLFFSLLHTHLKQNQQVPISYIDTEQEDFSQVQLKLETSFLGQKTLYWLKNCIELDEKKKKQLLQYLQQYSGPNVVGLFVALENQAPSHSLEIIIEPLVDRKIFEQLCIFFQKSAKLISSQFLTRVFRQSETIPLDTACLLMHYAQVLGTNTDYFISLWLEKIISPERSLFTLSAYLFAKKAQLFLQEWKKIGNQYSEQFWIAYWSEQLWRGYHYIEYCQAKQFAIAKKVGYRLPFTFMQRDWQQFKPEELANAHQCIYEIDSALKNGCNPIALDFFYSKFFLGEFKQIKTPG